MNLGIGVLVLLRQNTKNLKYLLGSYRMGAHVTSGLSNV
jgi:hypothetical protein